MILKNVMTFVILAFFATVIAQAADICTWYPSSWWAIATTSQLTGPAVQPGTYIDSSDQTTYTVNSVGPLVQVKTGQSFDVYRVTMQGHTSMSGSVLVDGNVYPFRVRNAGVTGEQWMRRSDLADVHLESHINGSLEVNMAGSWFEIGSYVVNQFEEFSPPREIFDFPVNVGETWSEGITSYLWGNYSMPGDNNDNWDDHNSDTVDQSCASQEQKNGVSCFRIDSFYRSLGGTIKSWYSPDQRFITYTELTNIPVGDNTITQSSARITSFHLQPSPTLTIEPLGHSAAPGSAFSLNGHTAGSGISVTAKFPDAGLSTTWNANSTPSFTLAMTSPTAADSTPQTSGTPDIGSHGLLITAAEDTNSDGIPDYIVTTVDIAAGSTPGPTATPSPSSPTPTPASNFPGVDLILSAHQFTAGDLFDLGADIINPTGVPLHADLYLALEAYGEYYFYPSWTQTVENQPVTINARGRLNLTILNFQWPSGTGAGGPINCYGLITQPGTYSVLGFYDVESFSFY